jgi:hypothetical protein
MTHEDHRVEGPSRLTEHHRDTAARIFQHPTSANIEWRAVVSLLNEIADVEERHDGKLKVSLAGQSVILARPRGKDIDEQLVIDLRHLLNAAGYEAPTRHREP